MPRTGTVFIAGLTLAAVLAGCSHPRYYDDAEYRTTTHGHLASQGHFAIYYPAEIALDFPGYVVGIEMGDRSSLVHDGDLVVERFVHAGDTMARLTDTLRDGLRRTDEAGFEYDPLPFVSHVVRYRGRPMGAGNCALYSVFQSSLPELTDFCDGLRRPEMKDPAARWSGFRGSWQAIDLLKDALRNDAASGNYSHLVIAIMGWRTPQEEAVRNFNSLVRGMHLAAKGDFRPLFVGITWVGPWSGRWVDPLIEAFAYANIAELADTLGLTWVGVLADEIALPMSASLPTVFITHSFGTRAATTALCIGPAIRRDAGSSRARPPGAIDRLLGFQAAFSLQRFLEKRLFFFYEDVYFPNDCDRVKSIVLTTSRHDKATRAILWADLAGNYRYFRSFCRSYSGKLVSCASVDATGAIEGTYDESMKVLYLDATELIRFEAPGTDGGSHSDIFRPPVGRFIWNLIAAPPSGASRSAPRR